MKENLNLELIIKKFNEIFIDILDEEDIVLEYATTADDIEDWDSLTNIQLIVAIEKHFKIKFKAIEIDTYQNVGEMCEGVLQKIS